MEVTISCNSYCNIIYTMLYMFKVLYKEWLSDQVTDRMMPKNSLLLTHRTCAE